MSTAAYERADKPLRDPNVAWAFPVSASRTWNSCGLGLLTFLKVPTATLFRFCQC